MAWRCPNLDPKVWRALGIGTLCLALLIIGLLVAGAASSPSPECLAISNEERVDCAQNSKSSCASAGCCWAPLQANAHLPSCFYSDQKMVNCSLGADPKRPFSESEMASVLRLFTANLDINGTGEVVAAPDYDSGSGGSYYFAWARDGALCMGTYLQVAGLSASQKKMDSWISWLERAQNQPDANGIDVLVEPKFLIPEGTPYMGSWCRPQNDGPGLRAITAMAYARQKPAIADRVWQLVKQNLDWVAENYATGTCDLWEEVWSTDFFWNRYTMRKALVLGSSFAESVGNDTARSLRYKQTAATITEKLPRHVIDGYVIESKNRQLDTAVLEAFNVGDLDDGIFSPLSIEVVTTLKVLTRLFCRSYQVNQHAAVEGEPGVLFGRYEGDTYDGGNPWILLTATAATLLYRQALATTKELPTPEVEAVLESLLGRKPTTANLVGAGDSMLLLVKKFMTDGMHMPEQIDRNTGRLRSAKDLTWSYANVLKAMDARKEVEATLELTVVEI